MSSPAALPKVEELAEPVGPFSVQDKFTEELSGIRRFGLRCAWTAATTGGWCVLCLVCSCQYPAAPSRAAAASASASGSAAPSAAASVAPCRPGEVASCSRCGERCASGFCRAGHCARAPEPFAGPFYGDVLTFNGDGFYVAGDKMGIRYSASGEVVRTPSSASKFRATAYANGKYYGVNFGKVVVAADPTKEPVDLGFGGVDRTLAVDGEDVYFISAGLVTLSGGKVRRLGFGPGGGGGDPTDLAV